MTKDEQIKNWLTIAFSSAMPAATEFFYFDRRDNQFFSILPFDYLLVDDKFEISNDVTTNYSKQTMNVLVDRMKRISSDEQSILSIPLADENRDLDEQIDFFLNNNSIDINTATIWETEDPSITINVD